VKKLIIFDLDGVLFESRDMHYEALNRALMYNGFAPISRENHDNIYNGLPTWKKLEMLEIVGNKCEDVLGCKQTYTGQWLRDNVQPDHSLIRLFSDLRAAGWYVTVASNAVEETVTTALSRLGLGKYIASSYSPKPGLQPKPNPDIFFRVMADYNVMPENTVIVEDSKPGLQAARATGAKVIEVSGPNVVPTAVRDACL
jgi:HAD superfamily hydrolase (TIGR01509 family)